MEAQSDRGRSLAMRWLINSVRGCSGKSMLYDWATELIDAIQRRGGAIKKRDDIHKMAEANKAFVHYRW